HRIRMLNYAAAASTYSYVPCWFDPHYAITIPKPSIQHEPRDVSNDGILLSLHEHIIRHKTGHSAGGEDSEKVVRQIINQSEKLVIVFEQIRVVERRVVIGRARHHQLDRLVTDLLHRPTVSE